MDIAKNIAKFRKAKGLTQEELGSIVGVSNQAVSKWENRVSMPDIMQLPAIADALGVMLDALYGIESKPKPRKVDPDEMPDMAYDELIRLFCDLFEGWPHRPGLRTCLSNICGGVLVSDEFSFVDRTYKTPDSEKIFASRTAARTLCDLADANVRRVLAFEYRHAFSQSKSSNTPNALPLEQIAEGCGLSVEDTEEALVTLAQYDLIERCDYPSGTTEYYFLISGGIYALAIFRLAQILMQEKCFEMVRDTSMISDYYNAEVRKKNGIG